MDDEGKTDRQSQVTAERVRLENLCGDLTAAINSLEGKLNNVLVEPEDISTDEDKKEQELVPLATLLRDVNTSLTNNLGKIRSIYNRLEN